MKEMCPNCKSNFAAKDINNINKNSIFIEKTMPFLSNMVLFE
ncbi:hypothetical protein P20439_0153 [Pseudoalteromonas sp. BSi20439]|nr:hypothetical protein P20439_0153 [Pseudoalteromonas sp. BSi20439]